MSLSTLTNRAVGAVKEYFRGEWNGESWSFNDIPTVSLTFMRLVYMLLSFAFTSSAFGYYFRDVEMIGGFFAAIGSFASILSLYFVPRRLYEIRAFLLIIGAFFGGASLGPPVAWLIGVDSGCVLTALVGISLGFRCYWAASMWARWVDLFCFSGWYLSIPTVLLWSIIASKQFLEDSSLYIFQICAPVLSLMWYVAIYSQVLVQKNLEGDNDFVTHSIKLFTHFLPVCLRFGQFMWMEISTELEEEAGSKDDD